MKKHCNICGALMPMIGACLQCNSSIGIQPQKDHTEDWLTENIKLTERIQQLEAELAMATDAANKGDKARNVAQALTDEVEALRAENVLLREALKEARTVVHCHSNGYQMITQALSATPKTEKLAKVLEVAKGLCKGRDWNNGTHAKLHGYKEKLIKAVRELEADE